MILDNIVIINNEDFHESRDLNFEFGTGRKINFTAVSIARGTSTRRQACATTIPHAPDELPICCLGDPALFLLECISELVDVLRLVTRTPVAWKISAAVELHSGFGLSRHL